MVWYGMVAYPEIGTHLSRVVADMPMVLQCGVANLVTAALTLLQVHLATPLPSHQ